MNDYNQLKTHTENRNKILRELKEIYRSNHRSRNIDESTLNIRETRQERYSPIVEDLLEELHLPKFRKYNDDDHISCYRCQHFLDVPQNFLQLTYDTVSTSIHEYKADLTFVQAIVWLKSAISSVKDISVEQFHFIFHKQWNGTKCNVIQSDENPELIIRNSLNKLQEHDSNQDNFDNDVRSFISIDIAHNKSRSESQLCNPQHVRRDKESSESGLGRDDSHRISPSRRYVDDTYTTGTNDLLKEIIIPSSPDMFEDSSQSQETQYNDYTELQTLKNTVHTLTLRSRLTQASASDTRNASHPNASDNAFCAKVSNYTTNYHPRHDEDDQWISNFVDHKTSESDEQFTPVSPCSLQSSQSSETVELFLDENINTEDLGVAIQTNPRTSLSFLRLNAHKLHNETEINDTTNGIDNSAALTAKEVLKRGGTVACSEKSDTERQIYTAKRKSRNLVYHLPTYQYSNDEQTKLSSTLLNFSLGTLNANDVAFESVKIILTFFQAERIIKDYRKVRCWQDTLEKEAVNAILNFCEIFEVETKTDLCSGEIIRAVTETLERIIGNTVLNKTTLSMYHISIILEFCNLLKICIGAIDFLTGKLKSYETVVTSTTNGKRATINNVVTQLHLLFYGLRICLEKYRTVVTCKGERRLEEFTIPTIIDFWKKKLNSDHTIKEEDAMMREQRWLSIFSDFSVIAAEHFTQFAEKSRSLIHVLTPE